MAGTRVVLVSVRGVVGDVVRDALYERDVDVVADLHDEARLDAMLARVAVDCVVWSTDDGDAPAAALLAHHPRLTIIALEHEGRRVFLHRMCPRRVPLGELSPTSLADVVEAAGR